MQNSASDEERNVIPRWRSLQSSAGWSLEAARSLNPLIVSASDYSSDIERWRADGNVEGAFDIYSVGILTGDNALLWEGGLQLIAKSEQIDPNVIDSVKRAITPKESLDTVRDRLARLESNDGYIRSSISMLRRRLKDNPRDIVTAIELARFYAIAGLYQKAEHWLQVAYRQAPDNRQVLRALVQLYDVSGSVNDALPLLWKAPSLSYDPLIQSAEIAAAQIAGRGSRIAGLAKSKIKGIKNVARNRSELALALATLDISAGVSERKAFQLVGAGLFDPSENALAQAVWLSDQTKRNIMNRFPNLQLGSDAYEARAYLYFEYKNYKMALSSAFRWYSDQPFQAHPLTFICTCAAVYCDEAIKALPFARMIIAKHSGDWNAVNAAVLVFIESNEKELAATAISTLEGLAHSDSVKSFARAARGLLCFMTGDFERAKELYFEAMAHARAAKRNDLLFTAIAFYVLGEAKSGRVSYEEIGDAMATLERLTARVPVAARHETQRMWDRIKEKIVSLNDVEAFLESKKQESLFSLRDIPKFMEET